MNTPVVNQPPVQDASIEVPPALKRVGQITGSLAVGALGGYIFYWITRLFARAGFLGEEGKGVINPLPYVLSGVASAALVETAKLVYDAAMAVLGDRSLYQKTPSDQASTLDKFRHHSWKLISKAEGIQDDADVVFSRLFGMRTSKEFRDNWKDIGKAEGIQEDVNVAFSWLTDSWISKASLDRELKALDKEIDALGKERGDLDQELSNPTGDKRKKEIANREKEIGDRETAIAKRKKEIAEIDLSFKKISEIDLSFMEISRIAFWQQISETLSTSVPQELGVYLVEACGYTIIGGHLFVWLHGLTFMNGLISKIGEVYKKMDSWDVHAPTEEDVKANDQDKPETVEKGDLDLESEKETTGKQASGNLVLCPT